MDAGVEEYNGGGQRQGNKLEEPGGACFDCNICLDFAVEPVVTLCGHLYCWPCIYRWLRQEDTATPRQCPVCKAALSPAALVPLYGRGCSGNPGDVPRRPTTALLPAEMVAQQAHDPGSHGNYMVSSSSSSSSTTARLLPPTVLGGTPVAILLWALGIEGADSYYRRLMDSGGGGTSPRVRRQEMQDRQSLHRISVFFLCCLILCLLAF